jgi:flagellar basal-body rod protein FlgG
LYQGVYNSIRGCIIQQTRLEVISNNLANAGTIGFKKDSFFLDEMAKARSKTNMSQGNMRQTGNELDLAISGSGFFKVNTPEGLRYTRNGKFAVNAEGTLVTLQGDPVMGEDGEIVLKEGNISVDGNGRISVANENVGQLAIVDFENLDDMTKKSTSYYAYDGNGGEFRAVASEVSQAYLEESNVIVTEEIVRMIETLRQFETYQKVLQTFDETDGKTINEVGKI